MQKLIIRKTFFVVSCLLAVFSIIFLGTSFSLETPVAVITVNTDALIPAADTRSAQIFSETVSIKTLSETAAINTVARTVAAGTATIETPVLPGTETGAIPIVVSGTTKETVIVSSTGETMLKSEEAVTPAIEPRVIQEVRSRIDASGRKMAEVNYSQKFFLNPFSIQDPVITTPQELQFRLHGRVGERITVDFEYDDTQKKQKISVVYTGDSRDAIQEVNFGDQNLNLPGTEFVAYNKQLFGLSVRGQYDKFKYYFIGSQVKGTSATKQFEGKTSSTVYEIQDINYYKNRYYTLARHINQDKERIYLNDQDGSNDNNSRNSYLSFTDSVIGESISGRFDLLASGIDYSISYGDAGESTVISFIKSIAANYVIVVCDVDANGGAGETFAIKDESNSDTRSGLYELKNIYYLGNRNIVQMPPNDQRFWLSVIDSNNVETPSGISNGNIGIYPNIDKPYIVKLDYDLGTIQFVDSTGKDLRPFNAGAYLYSNAVSTYRIRAEYKVQDFMLTPFMVEESEIVYLNGVKQRRDIDYTIDYQSGFLTFIDENRITDDSIIKVDYNYMSLGQGYAETLLGIRGELPLSGDFSIGSTYIFTGTPYVDDIPKYSSTPKSHQIIDVDSHMDLKSLAARTKIFQTQPFDGPFFFPWLKLIRRLVNVFASSGTPVSSNLALEAAYSWKNPNTFGKAMIDDMEGAKISINVPMTDTASWRISSAPYGETEALRGSIGGGVFKLALTDAGKGHNEDDDVSKAVILNYDLPDTGSWAAVAYPISGSQDLSAYSDLEFWVRESVPDVDFYVDIGKISEDADGSGGFPADVGVWHKGDPKTEDLNNDAKLNPGEDIGWTFDNGYVSEVVGSGNVRLDKEDLDNNGVLDKNEDTSTIHRFGGNLANLDSYKVSSISANGYTWCLYRIPLNNQISGSTDWTNIKHVRLWLKNNSGTAKTGSLVMDSLQIAGNKWTNISISDTTSGNSFAIQARNTKDNISGWGLSQYTDPRTYDLVSNDGDDDGYNDSFEELHPKLEDDLYGLSELYWPKEQSIAFVYKIAGLNTVTASVKQTFSTPIDFTSYKSLKFWVGVTNNSSGDTLFVRFGTDSNNYFESYFPVTFQMEN